MIKVEDWGQKVEVIYDFWFILTCVFVEIWTYITIMFVKLSYFTIIELLFIICINCGD